MRIATIETLLDGIELPIEISLSPLDAPG